MEEEKIKDKSDWRNRIHTKKYDNIPIGETVTAVFDELPAGDLGKRRLELVDGKWVEFAHPELPFRIPVSPDSVDWAMKVCEKYGLGATLVGELPSGNLMYVMDKKQNPLPEYYNNV